MIFNGESYMDNDFSILVNKSSNDLHSSPSSLHSVAQFDLFEHRNINFESSVSKNKISSFQQYFSSDSIENFNGFNLLAQKESNKIISLIKSEDYTEGEISKTQIYLESLYHQNPYLFKEAFQKSWVNLYSAKSYVLRNFVCVASCINYSWLSDKALVLVLGASSHHDPYVNEAALRAAEAWGNPDFINILSSIKIFGIDWLDDYKEEVISFLRELQ